MKGMTLPKPWMIGVALALVAASHANAQTTRPAGGQTNPVTLELELTLPANATLDEPAAGVDLTRPLMPEGNGGMVDATYASKEQVADRFVRAVKLAGGAELAEATYTGGLEPADVTYTQGRLKLTGSSAAVEAAAAFATREAARHTPTLPGPMVSVELRFLEVSPEALAALPQALRDKAAAVHHGRRPAALTDAEVKAILASGASSLTSPQVMLFDGQRAGVAVQKEVRNADGSDGWDGLRVDVAAAASGTHVALDVRGMIAQGFDAERKTLSFSRLAVLGDKDSVLGAVEYHVDADGRPAGDVVFVLMRATVITPRDGR